MEGTDFAAANDFLEHFGIKGMRWGVRKSADQNARDKVAKLDQQFEKAARNPNAHMNLWMESVKSLKKSGDLQKINNRPEFAASKMRLRIGIANRELQNKYNNVVAGELVKHLNQNANKIVNRSGTRRFAIDQVFRGKVLQASTSQWRIVTEEIKQADDGSLLIDLVRDEFGRIIDLIPRPDSIMQSDELGDFLAHFGIKGMKWGIRRKARPLSTDAKAKQIIKDKVKKDKVGSVSNLKLQQAIRRMQLEQDYKRLSVNEQNGVTRWLSSTLLEIGKREVQTRAAKAIAGAALKKVATVAVA